MTFEEFMQKVKVVSDEEAETFGYVVCAMADFQSPFPDNVFTTCHVCGIGIQHRPHVPKKPSKVCMFCMIALDQSTKH